ncbi:hypothetical protein SAMN05518847_1244 [Paenibacillus sp. OV219]|nr:hypothetical protein SAMN05518847_1244 [Paenibacillus sp. OV219]
MMKRLTRMSFTFITDPINMSFHDGMKNLRFFRRLTLLFSLQIRPRSVIKNRRQVSR